MTTTVEPTALFTPILDQGIRAVNFFNGRLLTGRDLAREQDARREADARLGKACGAGIAYGLEVRLEGEAKLRTVKVFAGLAVSRAGQTLLLGSDQVVGLATPAATSTTPVSAAAFGPCGVLGGGTYVAGDGLYLLTLAPISATEGKAQVLALDPGNVRCNTDANVEAVQLRLLKIEAEVLSAAGLDTNAVGEAAVSRLRNGVAYACFGFPALAAAHRAPGLVPAGGLLDAMGSHGLSKCDVPLALVYMTDSAGIVFVDGWAARRRIATDGASPAWSALVGEQIDAIAEAQLAQFQDQLDAIPTASLGGVTAKDWLTWLPPAGLLDADGARALGWKQFLGARAPAVEVLLAAGDLRGVLAAALRRDPVPPVDGTRYRVYRIAGSAGPARHLFVREAPNAPHAEEVWLDGARAALPGVADVQSAIDTLRARSCRQVVLWPGERGLAPLESLKAGDDVVLCFEPGLYKLGKRPIHLKGLGHVRIHGAGPGTRIVSDGSEVALLVDDCESVAVADLWVDARTVKSGTDESGVGLNGALTIHNTPSAHVERVRASCGAAPTLGGAGIVVGNDAKAASAVVHLIACEVAAGDNQVGIQCVNTGLVVVRDNLVGAADASSSVLRGIVVAGQSATEVHVEGNTVRGAVQAIAIGLSQKESRKGVALQAERVVVAGNRVQLRLSERDQKRNRFGVFVGNATSVLVTGNRVLATGAGLRELALEGLRLTGVYGQHVVVRDNHFDGCPIGIQFRPLEVDQKRPRVWAFQTNLAELAGAAAPEVLRMDDALLKLTIREHNQPVPDR
jgi:hypothetical protein